MARKSSKPIYLKIGEACKQLDIAPYVLRYWETEFPALAPKKSRSGQRVYGEKELRIIARIKELLHEECYTIAGAKKKLEAELEAGGVESAAAQGEEKPSAEPAAAAENFAEQVEQAAARVAAQELKGRLGSLRTEISSALDGAREILDLLESTPASR
ncbi:MAG: MerR family transcriptional regulator [Acidobacteriota bacterium]